MDFGENVALVFMPFTCMTVTFTTLDALLEEYARPKFLETQVWKATPDTPWDRVDFYVGARTSLPLANVHRFFTFNNWPVDRNWNYEVVVAVGYNNLSGIIVDVPTSAFPWCINFFGVSGTNILDLPLSDTMASEHVFNAACLACTQKKCSCAIGRAEGERCGRCKDSPCIPHPEKEFLRMRRLMVDKMLKDKAVLCPGFQLVLATSGSAYGFNKAYSSEEKVKLTSIMEAHMSGRDFMKEQLLRDRGSSFQLVRFKNGRLSILEEINAESRLRFEVPKSGETSKRALGRLFPHFGIAIPHHAFSLLNSAFENPGEAFATDVKVWNSRLEVGAVRLVVLVQFVPGWEAFVAVAWM